MDFLYRLSDVHYEVDMSLLGCNPKTLWNDIFFQIVDIVSVHPRKFGIILCKNVHAIYNELLDIFYSYINHPLQYDNIQIKFILLTEHISFLPENILENFRVIPVKRPETESYLHILQKQPKTIFGLNNFACVKEQEMKELRQNMSCIGAESVENLKEVHMLKRVKIEDLPPNVFNTIVDDILMKMLNPDTIDMQELRNNLYDMLIYNLDISECISYMVFFLLDHEYIQGENAAKLLSNTYSFFKYYNNNYRPIYHLECMVFDMINKIHYE